MQRSKQMSESFRLAVLLTLSGGFMDAYSYICRDGVFANAQTGNILLTGVELSTGSWMEALCHFCPVLAFTLGIAVADLVRYRLQGKLKLHWRQITVLAEALILFWVAFMPQSLNLAANSLTSFACGLQVESFRKVRGNGAATTMCIGNLRAATQSVCEYFFTLNRPAAQKGMLFYGIIGLFVVGAILGNLCVMEFSEKAILVSSLLLFAAFFLMFIHRED